MGFSGMTDLEKAYRSKPPVHLIGSGKNSSEEPAPVYRGSVALTSVGQRPTRSVGSIEVSSPMLRLHAGLNGMPLAHEKPGIPLDLSRPFGSMTI